MSRRILSLSVFLLSVINVSAQHSLNDYIDAAVKSSPFYFVNQSQLNSLALDSILIRATLRPHVNFTSNDLYAPVMNGYGYDEIITNGGNYNALMGVNFLVIGKNNLNNQYSSLTVQRQILELSTKLSERDLKQTVTAQYITVYGEQQLLVTGEKILGVLKSEDFILKDITQKGQYRQTDYLAFLVGYKQQLLSYSRQKLQAQNDLFYLNYLCGIVDTTYLLLPEPVLTVPQNIDFEKTSQSHQFFLDSLKLRNSIEQLKFNYKPKLNLFGDAGYNTSFRYHAERNFGASVGLNLSVPVYDGNQRKLQNEKLGLSESARQRSAEFYKKQFSMKQIQLMQQISETENLIAEANEQLKISEALMQSNNKLLQTGDVRFVDYALSLTNYITANAVVQQLINSKMQLTNQFNYLNY